MNRTYLAFLLAALTLAFGCTAETSTTPAVVSTDSTSTPTSEGSSHKEPAATDTVDATFSPDDLDEETETHTETMVPEGKLVVGSKAPSLDIEHWVSNGNGAFEAITDFEADNVYVVEFWATWCGPCVRSMPHLVELQNKHKDSVQVISVSNEDLETVNQFLARPYTDGGDDGPATYAELTSAYCLTVDPDGTVGRDYMEAAGQNGIPACFLVGKTGRIEWIGHPMELDEPLESVLNDTWDLEAYAKFEGVMNQTMEALQSGDADKAKQLLEQAREGASPRQLMKLEQLGMNIKMMPIAKKMQAGDVEGAVADMEALLESTEDGPMKQQLNRILGQLKASVAAAAENDVIEPSESESE